MIRGHVTAAGVAVAGATVMLAAAPAPYPDTALLTGVDGSFTIGTGTPGTYVVLVRADGYTEERVEASADAVIRVELSEASTR